MQSVGFPNLLNLASNRLSSQNTLANGARRTEAREQTKRRNGEASDDWRRGLSYSPSFPERLIVLTQVQTPRGRVVTTVSGITFNIDFGCDHTLQ